MTIKLYIISAVLCLYACSDDSNRVSIERPAGGSLANAPLDSSVVTNFTVSEALRQKKSLKVYVSVYKTSPDVDEVTFAISDPSSFDVHASSGSPAKVRISFLYFDEDRIKGYSTGLSPNECPDFDLNQLKGTTTDLVPEMLCEIVPNQS